MLRQAQLNFLLRENESSAMAARAFLAPGAIKFNFAAPLQILRPFLYME